MPVAPETFTTDRLALRRPTRADAVAIHEEYAADPDVARYLTWRPHASPETVAAFIDGLIGQWASGRTFAWVITVKGRDRAVGMIDAIPQGHVLDIGYVLGRRYWNRGYVVEALNAVTAWALSVPRFYRVCATCDIDNGASARVLEKAGFQREGVLRRWIVHPNVSPEPRDSCVYSRVR